MDRAECASRMNVETGAWPKHQLGAVVQRQYSLLLGLTLVFLPLNISKWPWALPFLTSLIFCFCFCHIGSEQVLHIVLGNCSHP